MRATTTPYGVTTTFPMTTGASDGAMRDAIENDRQTGWLFAECAPPAAGRWSAGGSRRDGVGRFDPETGASSGRPMLSTGAWSCVGEDGQRPRERSVPDGGAETEAGGFRIVDRSRMAQEILRLNPGASLDFLDSFETATLHQYLERLRLLAEPRGAHARWVRPGDSPAILWRSRRH